MNFGRRIVTLLLLVLILPIIAACGGTDTTTNQTTPVTGDTMANTAAPATAAPPAATADTGTGGNLGTTPAAATAGTSSGTTGGPNFSAIKVEEGATLTVNTWGDTSEQKINQDSFDRFKQLFPGVTINYQPVPNDFQVKLKADAAGGTLSDVFYLDASLLTAFAPNGVLLDLTPFMAQAGVTQGDYQGQLASIFVQDNKVYGLPKDYNPLVLLVRNDLAEKAGIDPKSIKTWDDWKNAAAKMSSGDGAARVYGQCSSSDSQRATALILQNGGTFVDGTKSAINSEAAVQAVQFWYDMYTAKNAALVADLGASWCGEAMGKGQVAMALEGGWMVPYMAKEYPDVKYTIVPLPTPTGGKQATLLFTNGFAASASSKFPNAAAALVLFLTSAQNQKPILETGFALSTVKSLANDPYFATHPNEQVMAEGGNYGTPADLAFGGPAKKDDVLKPIGAAFERIFLGQGDVKTNLDQAAQEMDAVLAK